MWNDLAAKSRTTPSAVLGMLDILNSRAWPEFDRSRLQDVVQGATELAVAEPDEADALRFLSTLAAKVANFDVGMLDDLDLSELARSLTRRSPPRALSFLRSEIDAGRDPVIPIVTGTVADLNTAARGPSRVSFREALDDCLRRRVHHKQDGRTAANDCRYCR
jgi:hypothetical protein